MDVFNLKKCKYSFKLFTQQPLEGKKKLHQLKALLKKGETHPSLMVPVNMQLKYTPLKKNEY